MDPTKTPTDAVTEAKKKMMVPLKKNASMADHEGFTKPQALALAMTLYLGRVGTARGNRYGVAQPAIATSIAYSLERRGLLRRKERWLGGLSFERFFSITGRGARAVRALAKAGWTISALRGES